MEAHMNEGKAKVLSDSEFKRLIRITATERHGKRNVALLMMSYGLGLRVAELSTLVIGDVMADDGCIKDHFQITKANAKNNKNREVFLSNPKVCKAINEYLTERRQNDSIAISSGSPLFRSQKGSRFTAHSLQMTMKAIYRRAGMPETVSSHSGRRTFATKLISRGTDIKTVQTLMGHASISQTAIYCEPNPETMRTATSNIL
jgi:integrase/recombinase XerD